MNNTFDGVELFGTRNKERGPIPTTRQIRSILPGIAGFRTYALGTNSWIWTVKGILVRSTRILLEADLNAGASYVDAGLYDFKTGAGTIYGNCLLNDFAPITDILACEVQLGGGWAGAFCQWVQGTVEWAGPTF